MCTLIQDLGHKKIPLQSWYWCERGLCLVPGKSGGRREAWHVLGLEHREGRETGDGNSSSLGRVSVSEQPCAQQIHLQWQQLSDIHCYEILWLAVPNKEMLWFLLEGIVKLRKPNVLFHGDCRDSAALGFKWGWHKPSFSSVHCLCWSTSRW